MTDTEKMNELVKGVKSIIVNVDRSNMLVKDLQKVLTANMITPLNPVFVAVGIGLDKLAGNNPNWSAKGECQLLRIAGVLTTEEATVILMENAEAPTSVSAPEPTVTVEEIRDISNDCGVHKVCANNKTFPAMIDAHIEMEYQILYTNCASFDVSYCKLHNGFHVTPQAIGQ